MDFSNCPTLNSICKEFILDTIIISRCSAVGSAPVSGLNHRSRRRIFEKSRKPLKTLTFSALPNVEKSSISRSDHMFDHLQKNEYFYHIEVQRRWYRASFGTMRSQVRVLSLRPKNSRKQAILTCFRLFFYLFFTKSAIFG